MRNRRWIVLAAAVMLPAFAADAQAQGMEIGFKLGAAFANVTNPFEAGEADPERITTFAGGGHIRFALTPSISLQPELLFMRKGAGAPEGLEGGVNLDYVEIPVLLRIDIPTGGVGFSPFIYAGPYGAFEVACKIDDAGDEEDCGDDDHETFDYGAIFGAGLGFAAGPGRIVLEGRYDLGLQNLSPEGTGDLEQKNRAFGVFIGYAVPLGR